MLRYEKNRHSHFFFGNGYHDEKKTKRGSVAFVGISLLVFIQSLKKYPKLSILLFFHYVFELVLSDRLFTVFPANSILDRRNTLFYNFFLVSLHLQQLRIQLFILCIHSNIVYSFSFRFLRRMIQPLICFGIPSFRIRPFRVKNWVSGFYGLQSKYRMCGEKLEWLEIKIESHHLRF